ncbi:MULTISPECIES: OST-HTH/LOTUS domain-containing protein [unclassified Dysgonomonas]|uniref:OST-HTH/LOTUS domain-containing protein n=1 Tax=unclassified Dysgonomonas TaxID=2630389 RepID=UPI002107E564|nr:MULTISPECIES: OST-HTH/LOTUS domain-containing protein [unclassified Dysgonomonas]
MGSGDTHETILQKEAHIFDEAFDFYKKEGVTLSELGFILKKIYPRYNPRRYGCKTLGSIYERLEKYEVVLTPEKTYNVIRKKGNNEN